MIVYSKGGFFVELIKGHYHVFTPGITHATCDSAYKSLDLAIARCSFLEKEVNNKIRYERI